MRLAAFKVPRQVLIVDDIPKGPTGKLQRLGLAEKLGLTAPDRARAMEASRFYHPSHASGGDAGGTLGPGAQSRWRWHPRELLPIRGRFPLGDAAHLPACVKPCMSSCPSSASLKHLPWQRWPGVWRRLARPRRPCRLRLCNPYRERGPASFLCPATAVVPRAVGAQPLCLQSSASDPSARTTARGSFSAEPQGNRQAP